MRFRDRFEAGRRLGERLREEYGSRDDVVVLALPRGGVPVGFELARALDAPLDVVLVRKLGVPGQEELAIGAIASGGVRILNDDVVAALGLTDKKIDRLASGEHAQLRSREARYRDNRAPVDLEDRVVIIVDDGLATGASMRAAVIAVRRQQPRKLVVGVPVASKRICDKLRPLVDAVICTSTPEPFRAVGCWYEHFDQTSDDEVHDLLARAHAASAS
jgi:predicted phosphoribosyltransferase